MYEFIRVQYVLGRITAEQVFAFVPKFITKEQAESIISLANFSTM